MLLRFLPMPMYTRSGPIQAGLGILPIIERRLSTDAAPIAPAAVKTAAHQNRPLTTEVLNPLTRTIFDSFGPFEI